MCGIVGYIGPKKVVPVIIEGLRKLEYRGYDSAGIAVVTAEGKLEIRRAAGKLRNLEEAIAKSPIEGTYGIGHTRWATHGRPTEENAHPHRDCSGQIVVVHNGIIENYLELKEQLQREGHKFVTETDTEIVAHLVEKHSAGNVPLEEAVRLTLKALRGIYALVFLSAKDPMKIVAARLGPPSVVGIGDGEYFVASDIPAMLQHTREMFFLADGDIAVLTRDGVKVMDHDGRPVNRPTQHVAWDPIMAEKGGYKHFMQKEIFEQPRAVRDTLLGRISQDTGKIFLDEMQDYRGAVSNVRERAHRGVRNKLARRAGRQIHDRAAGARSGGSGLRQRVSLSRSDPGFEDADGVHQPVGRDGRHAGGAARSQVERLADAGDLQRDGLDDYARSGGNNSDACRPGDRRGVDQSIHRATDGAACCWPRIWARFEEKSPDECAVKLMQEITRIPHKMEQVLQTDENGMYENLARQLFRSQRLFVSGARNSLPDCAGRRVEAEGNFLHSRGRLSGRRDEARTQRADR